MVQKNFSKVVAYLNRRGKIVNVKSVGKKTALTSTGKLISSKGLRRLDFD